MYFNTSNSFILWNAPKFMFSWGYFFCLFLTGKKLGPRDISLLAPSSEVALQNRALNSNALLTFF